MKISFDNISIGMAHQLICACDPKRTAKLVEVKNTSTNKPMAEIAWCKEAFKIAMKHSVDVNYREMWRTRLNAVLAQLRHR